MKKITLLIFFALALVSCGVNALNPEKLELQKEPVYGTPMLKVSTTINDSDLVTAGATFNGNLIENIPLSIFSDVLSLPTEGYVKFGNSGSLPLIPIFIFINPVNNTYTIQVFSDISNNPNNLPVTDIMIYIYKLFEGEVGPNFLKELAVTKPTTTGTIEAVANPLTYPVSDFKLADPSGTPPTLVSHVAYVAKAKKGSEVFGSPNLIQINLVTIGKVGGKINIPTAVVGNDYIGGKYKIWVLEQYQPKN